MTKLDDWKRRLRIAARLVVDYGDIALPWLERAEKEVEIAQRANDAKERAKRYLDAA